MSTIKDFLGTENARNKAHQALYVALIKKAISVLQPDVKSEAVLIGHHLTFETDNDIGTENEIPAADTLLFDHDFMRACFGEKKFIPIMQLLASVAPESRDLSLAIAAHDAGIIDDATARASGVVLVDPPQYTQKRSWEDVIEQAIGTQEART